MKNSSLVLGGWTSIYSYHFVGKKGIFFWIALYLVCKDMFNWFLTRGMHEQQSNEWSPEWEDKYHWPGLHVKALNQILHPYLSLWRECDNVVVVRMMERWLHGSMGDIFIFNGCIYIWVEIGAPCVPVCCGWGVGVGGRFEGYHQKICLKKSDSSSTEWMAITVPDPFHIQLKINWLTIAGLTDFGLIWMIRNGHFDIHHLFHWIDASKLAKYPGTNPAY